jgi:DNA-binding NtrC family response regulator
LIRAVDMNKPHESKDVAPFMRPAGAFADDKSESLESLIARLANLDGRSKLVGRSSAFLSAIAMLPKLAKSKATVLITGETGTGKELAARAIHYLGTRANLPFVAVNCGSLPDALLEDDLFGHERGAYTDARDRRAGLIAHANGGTLLLDEIDALSSRAQVSILRVLQEKRYRPVGSSEEKEVDVRIVGATNTCLLDRVKSGEFRSDLYYRLQVLAIRLPALRERPEDILPLATHFLQKHAPADGDIVFSDCACARMLAWSWPGNVRELENAVIRACALCDDRVIPAMALGLPDGEDEIVPSLALPDAVPVTDFVAAKRQIIETFEREYLTRLMMEHSGNISQAAHAAGKERRDLGRLLKKYQLDATEFKSTGS